MESGANDAALSPVPRDTIAAPLVRSQEYASSPLLSLLMGVPSIAGLHQVIPTVYYHTFIPHKPGAQTDSRRRCCRRQDTPDSGGQDEKDAQRSESGNPLAGPFSVEGAQPGDALLVTFQKVRLNRSWGYSAYRLGLIALIPEAVLGVYSDH
jgi:amidase